MKKGTPIRRKTHGFFVKFNLQYEEFEDGEMTYLMFFQTSQGSTTIPSFACQMEIHPPWRDYLAFQLLNSAPFRSRFCCWLIEMGRECQAQSAVKLCEHCLLTFVSSLKQHLVGRTRITVKLGSLAHSLHNLEPEIKWSIRILPQMYQQLQLEGVFAWLSTLGGAHSALGDYFTENAEIAWFLSVKQLVIAMKIGDPVLAAHCRLFMAISMMQRRNLCQASKIVRSVKRMIQTDKRLHEKRLINCYKAAWVRLKYIRQLENN